MTEASMGLLDTGEWSGKIFSDGWRRGAGIANVVAPATGEMLQQIGLADPSDVARAAERAAAAQPHWARAPYTERAAVLRHAGALWEEHAAEVQDWLVREAGSIRPKAAVETDTAAQECYEAAALASHPTGEIIPSTFPRLSLAQRRPVGVVGVIAPFNFPLILAIRSVAPALALGNAVVLKPDTRTAVSGAVSIARIFEAAGLPNGLLHVLPGGVATGEAVVTHPRIPVVSFTGSTGTGRRVGELAGRHLKRAHLELGGNSALIVLDDADLELAASAGAWGSFLHQGQICMTTGRHLVHESIAGDYLNLLAAKADRLPVGDPASEDVALGPIIDARRRDKIHSLVTMSMAQGARLLAGGSYEGLFYRPTVLGDVKPSMPAFCEEVFGPVAPVVVFADTDDLIALARDTEYGLSLGILSGDAARALEIAEQVPSGIVHINDQTVSDEAVAPFGGVGASGTGSRFGGRTANLEAFTDTRWVTVQGKITQYPF
jgi:benzaldehyde dehydrogenase (NAD)